MDLKNLENIEKGKNIIIAGSANSVKQYKDKIIDYKNKIDAKVIGINFMTFLCTPDYHLWTNKQRYRDLGDCINKKSTFLFGHKMPEKLIKKHYNGDYYTISYIDNKKYDYKDGVIYGKFRTAGVLAIMIAHVMSVKTISIVGMDGYTLYNRKELKRCDKSHHCYGKGYTDDASWERCKKKDEKVYDTLRSLCDYGINFTILTPTKFVDFYDSNIFL